MESGIAGLTIIPVTRIAVYAFGEDRSATILGLKTPLYVLIKTRETHYQVIVMDGEEKQLDEIRNKFPNLSPTWIELFLMEAIDFAHALTYTLK